ncbi:MAG TPA: 50S ribosomal protein L24 [Acidimicrobiales bacterium]|jgi:large subunit ribosomal protein L24|nr:50S ribosomal protein L24 [Acidimicrobiales bacterium]
MRIHKGDDVIVRSGKDKGKRAEVVRAFPATGKVILEGVNVAKRHAKPTRATQQGGVIDKFMPVHVSSVALWCKSHNGPARVGMKIEDDGSKVRICRQCGAEL